MAIGGIFKLPTLAFSLSENRKAAVFQRVEPGADRCGGGGVGLVAEALDGAALLAAPFLEALTLRRLLALCATAQTESVSTVSSTGVSAASNGR